MTADRYKEHLPNRFGLKEGAESFPLMVLPSVSNACNSSCVHCWYTAKPRLRKRDGITYMPAALLEKIFLQVSENNQHRPLVRITGTGEPFLMPGLTEVLVDGCGDKGVRAAVITNGVLVTPERSARLIDAGIEAIECSVDASDQRSYEKIRKGLKFAELIRNIDFMLEYRAKKNSPVRILVSVVDNEKEIDGAAVEAFWKQKVDHVIMRKYLTYGQLSEDNYSQDAYLPPDERVPCPYPFERMVILADGSVTFCNFDVEDSLFMGNINTRTIQEIWQGEAFQQWRDLVLAGRFEDVPLCAKCSDWKYKSWTHNFFKVLKKTEGKQETS